VPKEHEKASHHVPIFPIFHGHQRHLPEARGGGAAAVLPKASWAGSHHDRDE